jgi:hypothetical protein
VGHVVCMGEMKHFTLKILWEGTIRRAWEVNIKTDLKEVACDKVAWIYLFQNTVPCLSCEHGNEHSC